MSLLLIFRDVWFTGSIARGPGRSFVTGSLGALRDHDLPGICGDYGHRSLREIVWRAAGAMTGTMSTKNGKCCPAEHAIGLVLLDPVRDICRTVPSRGKVCAPWSHSLSFASATVPLFSSPSSSIRGKEEYDRTLFLRSGSPLRAGEPAACSPVPDSSMAKNPAILVLFNNNQ